MTDFDIRTLLQRALRHVALVLLILPVPVFADEGMLLDAPMLAAKLGHSAEFQLLDARSTEAQRSMPLAFATRYQPLMAVKKGMVYVVADNDAAALEIAGSIPAEGRSVFAVKGGAEAWKAAVAKTPSVSAMPDRFVVPKNTCEPGKTVVKLKSNKVLQQEKK